MSTSARRHLIDRVSARVFCHGPGGGNPVTVFSSTERIPAQTQAKLAQAEEWESVVVHRPPKLDKDRQSPLPEVAFFMPTGEQVNFCAHAAMGAVFEICRHNEKGDEGNDGDRTVLFTVADPNEADRDPSRSPSPSKEYVASIQADDMVALRMETFYEQTRVSEPALLQRMLDDHCGVNESDIQKDNNNSALCHGSIARPKTLVPLLSTNLLHSAAAPTLAKKFQQDCLALDDTTGLYLYAPVEDEDGAWECRQFPRASYPEDPATGIAAAALACQLKQERNNPLPQYKMYQGTAMGRPSLIVVDELELKDASPMNVDASFRLLGRVEIDEYDTVEIEL